MIKNDSYTRFIFLGGLVTLLIIGAIVFRRFLPGQVGGPVTTLGRLDTVSLGAGSHILRVTGRTASGVLVQDQAIFTLVTPDILEIPTPSLSPSPSPTPTSVVPPVPPPPIVVEVPDDEGVAPTPTPSPSPEPTNLILVTPSPTPTP